jgi:hypothetical protein
MSIARWILPLLVLAVTTQGAAQEASHVVDGEILDAVTGLPVTGALVQLPGVSMRTYADSLGYFRFDGVPTGVHPVSAHALGYLTMETMTEAGAGAIVTVYLYPSPVTLEEISITVDRLESRRKATPFRVITMSQEDMIRLNAFDAFEALERTPGLFLRYCSSSASLECIWSRGRSRRLRFVIDDMPAWAGAVELESYDVADLHTIEVIRGCSLVRVYTNRYVEGLANRGQRLDPFICRYP